MFFKYSLFLALLYSLCFEDSILLFSFIVFSLFLLNLLFVGLHMVFPNDVTVAMLMSQSEERAAMLVPETNPQGSKLYDYANNLFRFCFDQWPQSLRFKIIC